MVSKCANPACSARFLYLHDGKVFAVRPAVVADSNVSGAVVERYWLCGACAQRMTLVLHDGDVTLERLRPSTPSEAQTGPTRARRSAA